MDWSSMLDNPIAAVGRKIGTRTFEREDVNLGSLLLDAKGEIMTMQSQTSDHAESRSEGLCECVSSRLVL